MKKLSFAKSLASVSLAAVCALGIVGCSEQTSDTPTYTGGVAATVNGVEIPEDKVTQAIQDIRAQMSLTDEDAWGKWLAENDYTPESVREEIVNSYVDQELVKQGADSEGITADSAQVDQYVETMRGHYDSDTAWAEALEAVGGYSEDRHCLLCEDYDLLLRLYAKGFTGRNLPERLLIYTLPSTAKGSRTIVHRWNETVTRWRRFRELGVLGRAWPYVCKPLAVGLLPEHLLRRLKERHTRS